MYSKLESKLAEYEKTQKISSDKELITVIEHILEVEEASQYDKRDYDLIEECVDMLLELKCDDPDFTLDFSKVKKAALSETFAQNGIKGKRVFVKPWRIAVAVALIAGILALSVTSGVYLFSKISKNDYFGLAKGTTVSLDTDVDLFIPYEVKEYDSMQEIMKSGHCDGLLLPEELPSGCVYTRGLVANMGDHYEVSVFYKYNDDLYMIKVHDPATETIDQIAVQKNVGGHRVGYCEVAGRIQGMFNYGGATYILQAPDEHGVDDIILNVLKSID